MDTIVIANKARKVVDCHQNLCLGLELNRIFPHCSRRDFIAARQRFYDRLIKSLSFVDLNGEGSTNTFQLAQVTTDAVKPAV